MVVTLLVLVGVIAGATFGIVRWFCPWSTNQIPTWMTGRYPFYPTDAEQAAIDQWRGRPLDEARDAAHACDQSALYVIGIYLKDMKGKNHESDHELARVLFMNAAILGFAPAVYEIRSLCIDTYRLPWLTLVYLRLLILLGHEEYMEIYDRAIEYCDQAHRIDLMEKIEAFAIEKYELIIKVQQDLVQAPDKVAFYRTLPLITLDDEHINTEIANSAVRFPSWSEEQ